MVATAVAISAAWTGVSRFFFGFVSARTSSGGVFFMAGFLALGAAAGFADSRVGVAPTGEALGALVVSTSDVAKGLSSGFAPPVDQNGGGTVELSLLLKAAAHVLDSLGVGVNTKERVARMRLMDDTARRIVLYVLTKRSSE
jgi:hypothetical protein